MNARREAGHSQVTCVTLVYQNAQKEGLNKSTPSAGSAAAVLWYGTANHLDDCDVPRTCASLKHRMIFLNAFPHTVAMACIVSATTAQTMTSGRPISQTQILEGMTDGKKKEERAGKRQDEAS